MTALTDGCFVVTWTDSHASGEISGYDVRGQIFVSAGTKLGGEFLVSTSVVSNQYQSAVTTLADGRFVATWSDLSRAGIEINWGVRGRISAADGSKSGAEFLVNTTITSEQYESAVTVWANGRFVVTWTDDRQYGSRAVHGQIFNADGSRLHDEFVVNTATTSFQHHSSVAALADGRFVVTCSTWQGEWVVCGQIFAADGSKSGGEFLVNTTTAGQQVDSAVTALADGRFVVTWTDQSSTGGDTDSWAVRGQILDATTYAGTAAIDRVTGGDFDDRIYGYEDDDILTGGSGADLIYGGGGNDSIQGDQNFAALTGNDVILAEAGDDVVFAGPGDDVVALGADFNVAIGEGGNDGINGEAGNDAIDGGDGNDTLFGKADQDILFGCLRQRHCVRRRW